MYLWRGMNVRGSRETNGSPPTYIAAPGIYGQQRQPRPWHVLSNKSSDLFRQGIMLIMQLAAEWGKVELSQ